MCQIDFDRKVLLITWIVVVETPYLAEYDCSKDNDNPCILLLDFLTNAFTNITGFVGF